MQNLYEKGSLTVLGGGRQQNQTYRGMLKYGREIMVLLE